MKTKIYILLLLLVCIDSFGQTKAYDYKRELIGISDQWHKLDLPKDIFANISPDLSDIRIIGITPKKDTIEAPYLIRSTKEMLTSEKIAFKLLNQSHNKNAYYYSFKIPTADAINQIHLDFKQANFDWTVSLEGSQDQKKWYTIVEDYRILSINNEHTNYKHTQVNFPSAKFPFFRLQVRSNEKPKLLNAKLSRNKVVKGSLRNYQIKKQEIYQNKRMKTSEITIDLDAPVLISELKVKIEESFDYYRPIHIRYLTDSTKTEKGWRYNYRTITSGTLSSLEKNEFKFQNIKAQHLKVIISNQDNQALKISGIEVSGYVWQLLARFTKDANYHLYYGNANASKANYDISRFPNKIPTEIKAITLGKEQCIKKKTEAPKQSLFINKLWLWGIIGIMIILLAWFTLKMMKKTEES